MSQDEFTKLFKYMTERFDKIDEKFEKQTLRFDRLDNMIDELLKKQEINEKERLVIGHQLDRLDKWTHELANKIGYSLLEAKPEFSKVRSLSTKESQG